MCEKVFYSPIRLLVIQSLFFVCVITTQTLGNVGVKLESDDTKLQEGVLERDDNFIFNYSGNISGAIWIVYRYKYAQVRCVCTVYSSLTCLVSKYVSGLRSRPCPVGFSLKTIEQNICTHILYYDIFLKWWNPSAYDHYEKNTVEKYYELGEDNLSRLKQKPGNTKILLQIHDRIDKNQELSILNKISRNKTARENFINDTITYLKRHDLDGLDVVVLTKTVVDNTELKYRKAFADFLPLIFFELRSRFKPNKLQLTMTLLQKLQILETRQLRWMGFPRMLANVDHVHLLSYISLYDPVYGIDYRSSLGFDETSFDLMNTVKFISEDFKMPSNKIVIGFNSFGNIHSLNFTGTGRLLEYKEVCEMVWDNKDNRTFYYSPSSEISLMKTPRKWMLFESSESIRRKIGRGLQKSVKGFMLSDIFNDDSVGESCGTPFPLLRTINSDLTRLAAKSNEFVTQSGTNTTRQSVVNIGPNHNRTINCFNDPSLIFMTDDSEQINGDWNEEMTRSPIKKSKRGLVYFCTRFSPQMVIGINDTMLEAHPEHLKKVLRNFRDVHFHLRLTLPYLKIVLKLLLVNPDFSEDYTSLTKTIAYPAANRFRFIKGISNSLRDNQLDGIELVLLTNSQESQTISQRWKSLFAILFHDLHKELKLLHLTLGLLVEYDTRPSNYLTDRYILKHVDYINIIPYSREMYSNAPNPSVLADESLNYFIEKGVPPSKVITGMLGYAKRYYVHSNSSYYVPLNEVCFLLKYYPSTWKQSQEDGIEYLTNGTVIYVWATDESIKQNIQSALDFGVKGFLASDIEVDFYASTVCTDEKYFIIRTIHNLLTEGNSPKI